MTVIRWTEPASGDFLGIVEWLKARNLAAAARVGQQILDAVEMLNTHPYLGKPGRAPDSRELGITRFPYLIVYSVELRSIVSDPVQVSILRILHGAMLWPPDNDRAN